MMSPFLPFLVIALESDNFMTFLAIITTRTLSAFPRDRLSILLVNSAAKKYLDFH